MSYQNVGTPRFYVNMIEWYADLNNLDINSHTDEPVRKISHESA